MEFLKGLNAQQQEAVAHGEGPLLILAGAGSGKTRVITHRICHLVCARRQPGRCILAVTFTNKAADEMRHRVEKMLAAAGSHETPLISTFHSFCVRLLRQEGAPLAELRPGFTPKFVIFDEDDQLALLKSAYQFAGVDENFMPHRVALSRISHAKNRGWRPHDLLQNALDPFAARLAAVFERYEEGLWRANALDFDDLLLESRRLLQHDERLRRRLNARLQYLLVDEYQDTNRVQYELMRLLSQERRNVCAVGDEDQSIYSWRGADIRNILDFEKDFPEARVIRLEQNYRSTKTILDAAGAVVARNLERKGKRLWTEGERGEKIVLYEALDSEDEALFVAESIERLLGRSSNDRVAILYRTNWQSRQIEEALRRYGRSYHVVGGLSFYQRAEIKDILAYLKLISNPHNPISLHRIVNTPARGIGKSTFEQIEQHARERNSSLWEAIGSLLAENLLPARAHAALSRFHKIIGDLALAAGEETLGALLERVVDETGYRAMLKASADPAAESRLENLNELVNAAVDAAARGENLEEFLDHAALVSETDQLDARAQVSLLTLHNAKGLEWPAVFITGLEEGLFPHSRSIDSPPMLEEERRLCYVGMTRAQKRLFLTWARRRRRFGGGPYENQEPSRFLDEVPEQYLDTSGVPPLAEEEDARGAVDLFVERHEVRRSARKHTYTGKTYNSLENIAEFFREKGLPPPVRQPAPPQPATSSPAPKPAAKPAATGLRAGVTVEHPKYGKGLVLRREGQGEEAKLTVSFPGYGLKKLVAKYAGLKLEE
jgi:DNA helicase-2/ATP-dependent DNA helicase PcrA